MDKPYVETTCPRCLERVRFPVKPAELYEANPVSLSGQITTQTETIKRQAEELEKARAEIKERAEFMLKQTARIAELESTDMPAARIKTLMGHPVEYWLKIEMAATDHGYDKLILKIVELEQAARWIPLSERLPAEGKDVIIKFTGDITERTYYRLAHIRKYPSGEYDWMEQGDSFCWGGKVSEWMEIPQ